MQIRRFGAVLALAAMLSGCGGGGAGDTMASTPTGGGGNALPSQPVAAGCSLRERQDWAAAQLKEWYLFPETLPTSLDPSPYADVGSYVDALTSTARDQGKDRFFTYLTSIAEENAYYDSGSSAGFGIRLGVDSTQSRLFVIESFEGAPALAAGIDRGAEILAIGTSASDLKTVSSIVAASGTAGLTTALGPDATGTSRVLRISDAAGTRNVTLAKTDFSLAPVSSRYGAQVITDGGQQYGYVNLRTFISTADPALRAAFARFKAAGITNVIVDFRYNGGGLISIAQLMGDLMGANRSTSEVFDYMTFRPEKSAENETRTFQPQAESIAPTKVAFIGTAGTASASELVIAAAIPYLHANAALIGTNTYGKPVGQIALDKASCDDRLRVIAFSLQNANRQGAYYTGLANTVEASCQAADDIGYPLGDPREASTRSALDFLEGKSCTRITASTDATTASLRSGAGRRDLLMPMAASTAQREVPGLF
jgi:C-terminal processing protease CtpA/Prc